MEAVRTMAGDSGMSAGEMGEMGEIADREDGREGIGRRAVGRMMPVSGVDVAEARFELGWGPGRVVDVLSG